jgi:hippurate hydrolase
MTALKKMQSQNGEFKTWRHHLHQNPEIAFEETGTSDYIAQLLTSWGVEIHRGLAKTGIVATIKGKKGTSTRAIGLRADIDALPMPEYTNLAYASKNPGKMHACGHDGHTAMLLAAVKHLAETRDFDGIIHAVFQPAEEFGGGGNVMVQEGFFDKFPCDAIFGMHNWPYLPLGKVAIAEGAVSACCDDFDVTLQASGGHAAFPHKTKDLIVCGAQIVSAVQHIVSRNADPLENAVISVTNFNAGTGAYNVIPNALHLSGTIRTLQRGLNKKMEERFRHVVKSVAAAFDVEVDINWNYGYPSTVNTAKETDFARKIAVEIVGEANVQEAVPMMGGEDFAYFLEKCPGNYIFLGQAKTDNDPGLHTSYYDFNDDALPYGAAYWVRLAETWLK